MMLKRSSSLPFPPPTRPHAGAPPLPPTQHMPPTPPLAGAPPPPLTPHTPPKSPLVGAPPPHSPPLPHTSPRPSAAGKAHLPHSLYSPQRLSAGQQEDALVGSAGLLAMPRAPAGRAGQPRPLPRPALARGVVPGLAQALGLGRPVRQLRAASLAEALRAGAIDAFSQVAFDIDETLICARPPPDCPSPVAGHPPLHTVEAQTARLVRGLQDCGVPVIGLTARGPRVGRHNIPQRTDALLQRLGIDLGRSGFLPEALRLELPYPAAWAYGAAFCGYNDKGVVLAHLATCLRARRWVVVDDNLDHFGSLVAAQDIARLELTLVYYTAGLGAAQLQRDKIRWWWRRARLGLV